MKTPVCLVIAPSGFLLDERVFMSLGILRVADGPTRQALETQVTMSVIRERLEAKMNRAA